MCPDRFSLDTKCCTYLPVFPNFLVGRILPEPSMAARMERGGVSPLGVGRPAGYADRFLQRAVQHARPQLGYGAILDGSACPHYVADSGVCAIWRHREAVCATWFCAHDQGELGAAFWRALQQQLVLVEDALKRWCVEQCPPGPHALDELYSPDVDRNPVEMFAIYARYKRMWGDWIGREAEYFKLCAEHVSSLSWDAVLELAGPPASDALATTREALGGL